jgi:hypothetical protein
MCFEADDVITGIGHHGAPTDRTSRRGELYGRRSASPAEETGPSPFSLIRPRGRTTLLHTKTQNHDTRQVPDGTLSRHTLRSICNVSTAKCIQNCDGRHLCDGTCVLRRFADSPPGLTPWMFALPGLFPPPDPLVLPTLPLPGP